MLVEWALVQCAWALTQQPERKLPSTGQDLVHHTFEPVLSGKLPMRLIRGIVEPSNLLPPSNFSQLVEHKLCHKLACIHNLREAILKNTMATHVKDSVAAVMIPSCMDLIWDLLQSLQNHHQLDQQLTCILGMYIQAQLVADTGIRAMEPDCYVFSIQVD